MRASIRPLVSSDVDVMCTWRYDPPYERYDVDADPSDVDLMLSGEGWYAADDAETGELVGFFEFLATGDEIEVGLGLRPDLTGRDSARASSRKGWISHVRSGRRPDSRSTSSSGTRARSAPTSAPGSCAATSTCAGSPTGTRRSS